MPMRTAYSREYMAYSAEFKAEVITALLFNIAITADISTRYGVPPSHVRRWIRQLIVKLSDMFKNAEKPFPSSEKDQRSVPHTQLVEELSKLQPKEIQILLMSFEEGSF